jgi:hypothetical protein
MLLPRADLPSSGGDESPDELRRRAEHARPLVGQTTDPVTIERLLEFAAELETMAAAREERSPPTEP